MDQTHLRDRLVDLAEQLGLAVRPAPPAEGHPGGAAVKLRGQWILFLDPTAAPAEQIPVLVTALKDRPELQDRFLPPELRELLDEVR
ncbi:MAG: hypothetical protein ACLFUJ_00585 [Phycisphaerae bacterium]